MIIILRPLRIDDKLDSSQELRESRGGRPGLPIPNRAYGLCGRKTTLEDEGQLMMWLDHHLLSS